MKIKTQILQWIVAVIIAILIVNLFCFVYNRNLAWIDRDKAATIGIWYPNKILVKGTEGYGIYKVDKNGYLNDDLPLVNNYILVVGSSFTQGKEVQNGKRYTDLLNERFGYTEELLFYNVSQDAFSLPDIIKGFEALTQEFPDSSKIIIEIGDTLFSEEELNDSKNFREYDKNQKGSIIISDLNYKTQTKYNIKNYFPVIFNIKEVIKNKFKKEETQQQYDYNEETYSEILNEGLQNIKSIYNGEIIIIYHPKITIEKNGTMNLIHDKAYDIFKEVCAKEKIEFIDVGEAFYEEYMNNYKLPYGFINTVPIEGHFNRYGHEIMANEIYKVLRGED